MHVLASSVVLPHLGTVRPVPSEPRDLSHQNAEASYAHINNPPDSQVTNPLDNQYSRNDPMLLSLCHMKY
jgi:hypothetical protein